MYPTVTCAGVYKLNFWLDFDSSLFSLSHQLHSLLSQKTYDVLLFASCNTLLLRRCGTSPYFSVSLRFRFTSHLKLILSTTGAPLGL